MEIVLTTLAEQIPVALLFGIFIVYIARMAADREVTRDAAQEKRDTALQFSMDRRDELMRQFWASQQASNRDVLERLAESVEAVTKGVDGVTSRLEQHDQRAARALELLEKPTRTRRGTQP